MHYGDFQLLAFRWVAGCSVVEHMHGWVDGLVCSLFNIFHTSNAFVLIL